MRTSPCPNHVQAFLARKVLTAFRYPQQCNLHTLACTLRKIESRARIKIEGLKAQGHR